MYELISVLAPVPVLDRTCARVDRSEALALSQVRVTHVKFAPKSSLHAAFVAPAEAEPGAAAMIGPPKIPPFIPKGAGWKPDWLVAPLLLVRSGFAAQWAMKQLKERRICRRAGFISLMNGSGLARGNLPSHLSSDRKQMNGLLSRAR